MGYSPKSTVRCCCELSLFSFRQKCAFNTIRHIWKITLKYLYRMYQKHGSKHFFKNCFFTGKFISVQPEILDFGERWLLSCNINYCKETAFCSQAQDLQITAQAQQCWGCWYHLFCLILSDCKYHQM